MLFSLKLTLRTNRGLLKVVISRKNFILRAVVQSCHKRKGLALVLQLDFRKAFDSISWESLYHILWQKGSQKNRWTGLRCSPTLANRLFYLTVTRVVGFSVNVGWDRAIPSCNTFFLSLSAIFCNAWSKKAFSHGLLQHLTMPNTPCPVLLTLTTPSLSLKQTKTTLQT